MDKKSGSIIVEATVFFLIISLMIFIFYITALGQARTQREMVSDDLVSSELAAFKDIDMEKLGESDDLTLIVVTDPEASFETFKHHLKYNLNIDDNFKPRSEFHFIKSKVNLDDFYIYNVYGEDVEFLKLNSSGGFDKTTVTNGKGTLKTPSDKAIEATTIYAKISFEVESIFNNKVMVSTSEEVDIAKN